MNIKHFFIFLSTATFFTYSHSMNDHVVWLSMPKELWLRIIAQYQVKDDLRKTCRHFRDLASTNNRNIFVQHPLMLSSQEFLNNFLYYYAEDGDDMVVRNLLANGADPNARIARYKGHSILYFAVKNGHDKVVEALLEHPITHTEYFMRKDSDNLFNFCIKNKYFDIAKRILTLKDADMALCLCYAMENNCIDMVNHILSMKLPTEHLELALFESVKENKIEIVSVLLLHNVNIDCQHKSYSGTPLHMAVSSGRLPMVKFLIQHGAYIGGDYDINYLMKQALNRGNISILRFFLNWEGADIEVKNDEGKTLLMKVIENHAWPETLVPLVQLLLSKGADVNKISPDANSALHYVAHFFRINALPLLLAQPNIKVNAINNSNQTPLDIVYVRGHLVYPEIKESCINLLIEHGGKQFVDL